MLQLRIHTMLKFTAVAAVASFAAASSATVKHAQHAPTDFDWETISPSWNLHFTSCYDEFQCARLLVPVDWLEEDTAKRNSKTMAIAIIRMPANLTDASSHGGAVIVNPGGPGNSGIQEILTNGHFLRNLVDSSHKRFDVMSFDPRGMGSSTPAADCFASEAERQLYNAQSLGALLGGRETDLSDASVARKRANAQALGHKCMLPGPDGYVVQEFMSTASVARDMLQIVDKLENLRMVEKSSDETEIGLDGRKEQAPLGNADATKSKEDAGDEVRNLSRLQYLGLSYGTMLGNTFISMFPERVKRMILDGVIVPEDYTAGDWTGNLLNSSHTIDYFYQSCFGAGSRCALFNSSDKSWHDIKAKVTDLIAQLEANPVIVAENNTVPTIFPGSFVVRAMYDPIYAPIDKHSSLAESLAQAIHGNYSSLISSSGLEISPLDTCINGSSTEYTWGTMTYLALRCGDGDDLRNATANWWRGHFHRAVSNSPEMGPDLAATTMACVGWQARPKFRFTGPFGSPQADPNGRSDRPSAPVLFLSSRYDPITPLASARIASKAHSGSRVLVQNSTGHCATLASPSKCTKEFVARYMDTGELPPEDAECSGDCVPFEDCPYLRAKLSR